MRARAQADRFARPDERTDGYSGSNARNGRRNAVDGRIDLSACVPSQNRTRRYCCALKGRRRYSVFTSGTTNSSKAVVLTSSSLCASAWNGQAKCPCNETDNLLCMLPLTHVFGFVCAMLWPMSQGAKSRSPEACAISRKIANISNPRLYPSCLQF